MLQTIFVYNKKTRWIIAAIKVNTIITDAEILKDTEHDVFITTKDDCATLIGGAMFLKEEYTKGAAQ